MQRFYQTMSLANTLTEIGLLQKQLAETSVSAEEQRRLWEKFRLEWNYNSNHIEGNTLTYGETMLLLVHGKTTGDHEKREYDEMQAHDLAIKIVRDWAADKDRDITEADIRELNRIILKEPFWKEAITVDGQPTRRLIKIGSYKEFPNSVRLKNGEMFHYSTPQETPHQMKELMDWYREHGKANPVVLAAELHYRFIRIHPFDDGNGRIARLMVNYVLMKNNLPPVIVKSKDKESYLTALQKADAGNREAFHEYIARQVIWSLELSLKAARGESIQEPDDIDKEIALFKKEISNAPQTIRRDNKLVAQTYLDVIKKVFDKVELKHHALDELFFDNSYRCSLNDVSTPKYTVKFLDDLMGSVLAGKTPKDYHDWEFVKLALSIEHREFAKDGGNLFFSYHKISVDFFHHRFIITDNFNSSHNYVYNEKPNDDALSIVVSDMMKKVLEDIKIKTQRKG